jgi:hypothetical protein
MLNTNIPNENQTHDDDRGEGLMVHLRTPELARLDKWASKQSDQPSRAEALRQLANKMLDLLEPPIMGTLAAFEQTETLEPPWNPLPPPRRR